MAAKYIVLLCAQVFLIQMVSSQYLPSNTVSGNSVVDNSIVIGNNGLSGGLTSNAVSSGLAGLNIQSSGPFIVTSISPIGPSGLAVASENTLEGTLTVSGQLPYLSAVAFEGTLPTAGSGVATCGCGNGDVRIVNEGLTAPNAARRF